jgi:uncharacterized protein (DUF342 family)
VKEQERAFEILLSSEGDCARLVRVATVAVEPPSAEAITAAALAAGVGVALLPDVARAVAHHWPELIRPRSCITIARGKPVRRGAVSRYRFFAAEDAVVTRGQVLAERVEKATGAHGYDVTGRILRFDSRAQPELMAGCGVILTEPAGRFIAQRYGRLRFMGESVAVIPLLRISDDGLAAEMEAFASVSGSRVTEGGALEPAAVPVSVSLLRSVLLDAGIKAEYMIEEALESLVSEALEVAIESRRGARRIVASGRTAVRGRDAFVEFLFAGRQADPRDGLIGDAEVLARDVVEPGQVLAVKMPAAVGIDGVTVRGERIMAASGRDQALRADLGVEVDPAGLLFRLAGRDPAIPVIQSGILGARSLVAVSPDLLVATFPAPEAPRALIIPGRRELEGALDRAGVCFGIDEEGLSVLASRAGAPWPVEESPVVLARGIPPEHGAVATFTSHIEEKNRFAGAAHDEQVDFREMIHSRSVEPGRVLATRTPPEPGVKPGISVRGSEIPCLSGADSTPAAGRGVVLMEDATKYVATREGIYTHTSRTGLVEVLGNYVVSGDVDYSVGRIKSTCMVTVEGKVAPGFAVCAEGPVYVAGSIEGAVVRSNAEVCVGGGVYSLQSAEIHAGGDVDVAIVDRAVIRARGNLRVRREAINADLRTLGTLLIGPGRSRAVGGSLGAVERVEAAALGSELGVPMEVAVGASVSLDPDEPALEPEGGWTALIPRGGIYSATVRVHGAVHPGVVIRILQWELEVSEALYGVEFILNSNWRIEPRVFR